MIRIIYIIFKIITRDKARYYSDIDKVFLNRGYVFMFNQISENVKNDELKNKIYNLLNSAWCDFENGDFPVDGATFIPEQDGHFFNSWWFIHDWRNINGYVGKDIDSEMLDIMILLNVPQKHFRDSIWWFKYTWINKFRHFLKGDLKRELPNDLIRI